MSEARLAFAMCRARGVGGIIADDIDVTDLLAEAETTLEQYGTMISPGPTYPAVWSSPSALSSKRTPRWLASSRSGC